MNGGGGWYEFFIANASGMENNKLIQTRYSAEQIGLDYGRALSETQIRYQQETMQVQIKVGLFVWGADTYRSYGQWCRGFATCNSAITDPRQATDTFIIKQILAPAPGWVSWVLYGIYKQTNPSGPTTYGE